MMSHWIYRASKDSITLADSFYRWVAAGFGSGWLPKAPGTWGSLAALFPAWVLLEFIGGISLWCATIVVAIAGCLVCFEVLAKQEDKDPGWIVIDEWAGQWLALVLIFSVGSFDWFWFCMGFVAFRLFDILKPWPVSLAERLGPVWWSIMADDLVAGAMGGGVLVLARLQWGGAI